jgi:hypothetical protein
MPVGMVLLLPLLPFYHIMGDHQQMLRSFRLIGRHVMPAIRAL